MSNGAMSDPDVSNANQWYIVKQADGHCDIVPSQPPADAPPANATPADTDQPQSQWGPFDSQAEAIARRVGLIRAGKCQPV